MTIVLDGISKRFGNLLVVNRLSLQVKDGELFVLLGRSGSGKSTVLRLIAGLILPDQGRILLHDRDVTVLPPQVRNTGFVFQNYAIFKHMSVAENVEYGLRVRGVKQSTRRSRSADLLELVGLGGLGSRYPAQLSGGQRQRVALARALAYEPSVLLLDEPFGALDPQIRNQLRHSLQEIQRELHVTSILVTHDQEEAYALGDRIAIIERGRLVEVGTPADLYYRPKTEFVAAFLGGGNVVVGRCSKGRIQLGSQFLPFPAGSPAHEEGTPVRLLFRPEMVRFQETAFNDASGTLALGQGALTQRTFAGASERFHFDLEHLQGIRPLSPTLKYGQRFASVVASRPSAELSPEEQRLAPGVQRNLGLVNHHVLNPSNLRFLVLVDQDQNFRFVTGPALQLTHAAHGQLTLLRVTGLDGDLSADRRGLQKLAAELVPKEDLHVVLANRQGEITAEIINEIQSSHPDMLLLGRPASEDPAQAKRLAVLVRRIVINTGLPLFIGTKQISKISRLLVCTLGGEAGKVVVRFAARLARHIQPETVIFHALSAGADDSDHRRMDRHLRDASALFTLYNVKNQIKLVSDLPFSGILAESENHDLIVLGASSRIYRGASRERELATYLVRQSNKAVLVVPTTTD